MSKNFKESVDSAVNEMDFSKNSYQIEFETDMGKIRLDLFHEIAPKHCENIAGLVKSGFYDNIQFHRVVPNFVIQAGCPQGNGTGGPGYTIDAEFNERPHKLGVLSMARTQDPNSAGSQFFLCLADVPYLDGQYTVFGEAADEESKKVITQIGNVETGANDMPKEPIRIHKAILLEVN